VAAVAGAESRGVSVRQCVVEGSVAALLATAVGAQKETEAYGSFSRPRVLARLPRDAALLAVCPRAAPPRVARPKRPWAARSLDGAASMAPLLRPRAKGLLAVSVPVLVLVSSLSRAPRPGFRPPLPPRGFDMSATGSRAGCGHAPACIEREGVRRLLCTGRIGRDTAQTVPMVEVDGGCVGCDKESSRFSMNLQTALGPK
jgi:hypothetical protein